MTTIDKITDRPSKLTNIEEMLERELPKGERNMKKVFLGGTCNESTWRDIIIKMLEIDYFNPVVNDWTEECMAREIEERKACNFCLYAITPKMTGTYSIAEVVDDSNKRPEKTIFVPIRKDKDYVFTDGQWKSLMSVSNIVSKNGALVFDTLRQSAEYMNISML